MDNGPSSPGYRPEARQRGFSFRSDKSGGSTKEVLRDSPEEKRRRDSIWKLQSKANPNAAITEAQPGDAQLLEQATIESLRNVQHKDANGNVITDPDLSNPTRPRMERPLDTIRSFEKAIDSGYKRRSSMMRGESNDQQNQHQSRRSSYIDHNSGHSPARYGSRTPSGGGYYGNGTTRPDSYAEGPGSQRQRYGNRVASDTTGMRSNGGNGVYPQHGYHQSHDTVGTNGSDSTGPWANSTDPSSENSSLDRLHMAPGGKQPQQQAGQDFYGGGNNGYGGPQNNGVPRAIPEDRAYSGYGGPVQQQQPRRPIPLGNSGDTLTQTLSHAGGKLPSASRPEPEKKKGWLTRKFSKKG
ncbi:hypothetical protein LTR95_012333 [Oleoguttula sp. CCFEE 5521]